MTVWYLSCRYILLPAVVLSLQYRNTRVTTGHCFPLFDPAGISKHASQSTTFDLFMDSDPCMVGEKDQVAISRFEVPQFVYNHVAEAPPHKLGVMLFAPLATLRNPSMHTTQTADRINIISFVYNPCNLASMNYGELQADISRQLSSFYQGSQLNESNDQVCHVGRMPYLQVIDVFVFIRERQTEYLKVLWGQSTFLEDMSHFLSCLTVRNLLAQLTWWHLQVMMRSPVSSQIPQEETNTCIVVSTSQPFKVPQFDLLQQLLQTTSM